VLLLGLGIYQTDRDDSVGVKVIDTPMVNADWNPYNGVTAPFRFCFTRKLAFICFGAMGKFHSPTLSTGSSLNLDKEIVVAPVSKKNRMRER
jgi:hypothetical protein